jgi:hypothetical protein
MRPVTDAQVDLLVASEIGVNDSGVLHNLVRRSFGNHGTFGHDHYPVGDVTNHVHVVLDEQDGHALLFQVKDVTQERFGQCRVHTGHGLIEHHQGGNGHQGPRHLEQLSLTTGQAGSKLILQLGKFESLEKLERTSFNLGILLFPNEREQRAEDAFTLLVFGARASCSP